MSWWRSCGSFPTRASNRASRAEHDADLGRPIGRLGGEAERIVELQKNLGAEMELRFRNQFHLVLFPFDAGIDPPEPGEALQILQGILPDFQLRFVLGIRQRFPGSKRDLITLWQCRML